MLDKIVAAAPNYLLIVVRCFVMIMTMPLFSTKAVPRVAKVGFAGFLAFAIMPQAMIPVYSTVIVQSGSFSIEYLLLIVGEAIIGAMLGFFVSTIFAAFSTAGQLFAFQIGFSAAEVYDALSQVENPLMGQFLNLVAMLLFLQPTWLNMLFFKGLTTSFQAMSAYTIATSNEAIALFMTRGLSRLFASAFIIALPIMGTLFLINVTMGILAKAAPQMNLLSEGFPLMLLVTFGMLFVLLPELCGYFTAQFRSGFSMLEKLFIYLTGGINASGGSL